MSTGGIEFVWKTLKSGKVSLSVEWPHILLWAFYLRKLRKIRINFSTLNIICCSPINTMFCQETVRFLRIE
jgi:hypothetical protein